MTKPTFEEMFQSVFGRHPFSGKPKPNGAQRERMLLEACVVYEQALNQVARHGDLEAGEDARIARRALRVGAAVKEGGLGL